MKTFSSRANPILASFRLRQAVSDPYEWAQSLECAPTEVSGLSVWQFCTPDHIDHAHRVLARLAAIS